MRLRLPLTLLGAFSAYYRLTASLVTPLVSTLAVACAALPVVAPSSRATALHTKDLRPENLPNLRGAQFVPISLQSAHSYGTDPNGAGRKLIGRSRVLKLPRGAVMTAPQMLPDTPSLTQIVSPRLGGGVLFQVGPTIYRADNWLAPVYPIFFSSRAIAQIVPGLDRLYVRTQGGVYEAIDPRTGQSVDMGPWPASPFVGAYGAVDGWRAAAIADTRGIIATFDAGATWRTLRIPNDPKDVLVSGDRLYVTTQDPSRRLAYFELRPDGQVAEMNGLPPVADGGRISSVDKEPNENDEKFFGERPLVAAVEDGWPLSDGTLVVARDGALGRVRASDGLVIETVPNAYALKPSRCHAFSFGEAEFGFVCGQLQGKTALYRYDTARGEMAELRIFDTPRAVLSFSNGALAVRGPCNPRSAFTKLPGAYCIYDTRAGFRDWIIQGATGEERIVVLASGQLAVIAPGSGAKGTLTLFTKGRAETKPLTWPELSPILAHALPNATWLDGFEERRGGILGGWLESAGTMVGIEIGLDGRVRTGSFIRDLGLPLVSGRYGLAWRSGRGYETTDGGMAWRTVDLPDAIESTQSERACGPGGCRASGWLRVGWGEAENANPKKDEAKPIARTVPPSAPTWTFDCERAPVAIAAEPKPAKEPFAPLTRSSVFRPGSYVGYIASHELPAFYRQPAPKQGPDDLGLSVEISDGVDRSLRPGSLARIYTWGPRAGGWEHLGQWEIRWVSPFDTPSRAVRKFGGARTAKTQAPFSDLDDARRGLGIGPVGNSSWSLAFADDPDHALLVSRRGNDFKLFALEADRPPSEVRRGLGDWIGLEIEAAVRSGNHWYIATTQPSGERPQTIVWIIDGTEARELTRIPRAGFEHRPMTRLARKTDGRQIALIVDGQPNAERAILRRWAIPIHLGTGALDEPELLGSIDFAGMQVDLCSVDQPGWILDSPLGGASVRVRLHGEEHPVFNALGRIRWSAGGACVMALAGNADSQMQLDTADPLRGRRIDTASAASLSLYASRTRFPLICRKSL